MAPPGTPRLSPRYLDHPIFPGSGQGGSFWLAPSRVPPAAALLSAPQRPRFASPRGAPGARPLPTPSPPSPGRGSRTPHLSGAWRADWACSGARPWAVGAERMHSPGRGLAVQGHGAQAAALADALASLRRTRARMASLTAYGTAGGRAGGAWDRTGTPGNFGVRVCLRGCQAGSRTLGLRDPSPRQREDAWEPGGGYLPVEPLGTPKGSHWGASGLQKNSTLCGVLTRDAGCQILLRV